MQEKKTIGVACGTGAQGGRSKIPLPVRDRGMGRSTIAGIAATFGATALAAAIGSAASISAAEFYGQLAKPAWAPPAWVFGPVWTALYIMMAAAAWLIWRSGQNVRVPMALFLGQLALNALWSWAFFRWHSGPVSMLTIVALWAGIVTTMILFWRIHRPAGALLLLYLAWVSFASMLNAAIWRLNPNLL